MSENTASKRRLFAINSVDDGMGGTLRVIVNLADQIAKEGEPAAVTAPWIPEAKRTSLATIDPRVERKLFKASWLMARFGGSLKQYRWLRRHITDFDEVHIQSTWYLAAVYIVALGKKRGVPVFVWPQSALDPYDVEKHSTAKRIVGPLVIRWMLNNATAVVCATGREEVEMVTYGAKPPMVTVPLPVVPLDTSRVDRDEWRTRHGVDLTVPVVLFMGRVNYKKRLPLLLDAMAKMKHTDAILLVAGSGEDSEMALVEQKIAEHGLQDRVVFTGWLEGDDRVGAVAASDVFALISDMENFGLAPVEALSAGVPVVVSDMVYVGDELGKTGAAIVVERDADQTADALDRLLDQVRTDGELAALGRTVAEDYAPASVVATLREQTAKF